MAFLSAEWRHLVMLNFRVDRDVLQPLVPGGTELDTWRGDTLVSVVGFRFLSTRVLGLAIPFHRDFDEVNLRFYVRRRVDGAVRRGVVFVREIVPRRAIALVAKLAYEEPYIALPMRSVTPAADEAVARVEYAWRSARGWNRVGVRVDGESAATEPGTEEEFVTEPHWGYTRRRDGSTIEYEVQHPRWRMWRPHAVDFDCDVGALYGAGFVDALGAAPCSAMLADGSPVTVYRPQAIA